MALAAHACGDWNFGPKRESESSEHNAHLRDFPTSTNPLRLHPRHLVLLCLLALVWCQTAMAAGACLAGLAGDADVATDCHGVPLAQGATDGGDCPGCDVVPDGGKLPHIAPLPAGHDFALVGAPRRAGIASRALNACPRDGPSLNTLCRLLI